jgi:uncharacterized protein
MFFRDKKQARVIERIEQYCQLVGAAVVEYSSMVHNYLDADKQFKEKSLRVHELESEADRVRFDMEREMVAGAFLPAYREDYIDLVETIDRVANKAEDSADLVYLVRPEIPAELAEPLREIADNTVEMYSLVCSMVSRTLRDDHDVQDDVVKIGRQEKKVDQIQFTAVRTVYKQLEMEKVDKLVLKMVIDQLCEVSDRIENVADRISIIAIKRSLG